MAEKGSATATVTLGSALIGIFITPLIDVQHQRNKVNPPPPVVDRWEGGSFRRTISRNHGQTT